MEPCPACGQPAFSDGWCTYCGHSGPVRTLIGKPLPDPVPLDPSAILEVEPLSEDALEVLPLEALEVIEEPAPLPLDALRVVSGAPLELVPLEPEEFVPPMEGLETWDRVPDVGSVPLEGLETTELEVREIKPEPGAATETAVFQYQTCPGCNAAQPDPPPTFCEACGQRLKLKVRGKRADLEDKVKCRECGVPNRPDAGNCINCGFKLRVSI